MESKKYKSIALFPVYFKKIGIISFFLLLAMAVIIKLADINMTQPQREIYKIILADAFTMCLVFVAMSKDKTEDERTSYLRLLSLNNTLFFVIPYVLFYPLATLLFGDKIEFSAIETINFLLVMYLLSYYGNKEFM